MIYYRFPQCNAYHKAESIEAARIAAFLMGEPVEIVDGPVSRYDPFAPKPRAEQPEECGSYKE